MNRIYRLIWSHTLGALVPVAEIARSKRRGLLRRGSSPQPRQDPLRRALALALGLAPALALAKQPLTSTELQGGAFAGSTVSATQPFAPPAVPEASAPLPVGGQVVSGQATIGQSGNTLTVTQNSQNTILNWQSFSIGADQTVTFNQPGSSSVALNRVLGSDPSAIYGHLDANGQVFLVNPNGIYFAPGAQVDVGGIVASTLDITDQDFLDGTYRFAGSSMAGVRNDGSIQTVQGGYVAFIGRGVTNHGAIATPGGTTALGAGSGVNLTLAGNSLLNFQVDAQALGALAANGGLIRADGGRVILSAQARDALLETVVNNTGRIQAQTAQNQNGTIELLGGDSGTVQVSGTLDASAPNGGDGGFIETSGAHLKVADGSTFTTKSACGSDGQWLIDPYDFTIASSGGDITGSALSAALGSGNVTIQTTASNASCTGVTGCGAGNSAGNGDIFVNAPVSWSANTKLTLSAYRNIEINQSITATGTGANSDATTQRLILAYNQSGTGGDYIVNAPVNLPSGLTFTTNNHGAVTNYSVITSLGSQGSTTGTDLQGMTLSGHYALGANIDASSTSGWNSGAGFAPIGTTSSPFTGTLAGLGHTINGLVINQSGYYGSNGIGLFGTIGSAGVVRDLGLAGGSIGGMYNTGALVGYNAGTLSDVYSTASINGHVGTNIGGLVGYNTGTISNAYTTGTLSSGGTNIGGLAGRNNGTISNAYAIGNVTGLGSRTGGLVGLNNGTITNAYATGHVQGDTNAGGLVGGNYGHINNAYATGSVSVTYNGAGGLIGVNGSTGVVSNAYATGKVSFSSNFAVNKGGVVGTNYGGSFTNVYWDTTTSGTNNASGNGITTGVTGLTTAQLAATLPSGFSSSVWANAGNQTTPYLLANTSFSTVSGSVSLGTDTSATPTQYNVITRLTQLQNINSTGLGLNYVLGGNIDASATSSWNGGAGFTPIGSYASAFSGTLDGLGYAISNLSINLTTTGSHITVGLVGRLATGGQIRNLGLQGGSFAVSMTGAGSSNYLYAGGLVGYNSGSIDHSYSTVSLTTSASGSGMHNYIGGLVGSNAGTSSSALASITNSYATGSISSQASSPDALWNNIGGLVGNAMYGSVSTSYASGDIGSQANASTALWNDIGGLVGGGEYGSVSDSYATGNINSVASITGGTFWNDLGGLMGNYVMGTVSTSYATGFIGSTTGGATFNSIGGLVGSSASATINNSFWDTETTGTPFSAGGTGLTTAQMLQQASFTGFDFTSPVWVIYQDHTMPLLNVFLTPLTVTAPNQSQSYTGGSFALLNPVYSVAGADTSGLLFGLGNPYNGAVNVGSYSPDLWSDQQGYRITIVGGGLTITPKALTLSGLSASNKIYDGSTAASIINWGSLSGVVGSDSVSLVNSGASAAFVDANAGTGKTVTASGLSLTGTGAGNYVINAQTTLADITPKTLSLTGLTADNKVYDGTTAATIGSFGSLAGILGSDSVSLASSGTSASFADANAGTGKTISVTGLALSGSSAGNYSLASTDTTLADITPRQLTASLVGNLGKLYDGTTAATLDGSNYQLIGFVSGQGAVVTQTTGTYASADVGTNIAVTANLGAGDFAANSGTVLGNYLLPASAAGFGAITSPTSPALTSPTSPALTSATASASQGNVSGFLGVDGFALPLDARMQWRRFGHGSPSTVSMDVEDNGSIPPCSARMMIDAFAAPTAAGACSKH